MSTHLRQGFSTLWRRQVGDGREWTPKVGRREKNKNIVCMSFKYEPRILDLRYASAIRSSQAVHHRSKRRERIEKVDTEKKKKKIIARNTRICVCVCWELHNRLLCKSLVNGKRSAFMTKGYLPDSMYCEYMTKTIWSGTWRLPHETHEPISFDWFPTSNKFRPFHFSWLGNIAAFDIATMALVRRYDHSLNASDRLTWKHISRCDEACYYSAQTIWLNTKLLVCVFSPCFRWSLFSSQVSIVWNKLWDAIYKYTLARTVRQQFQRRIETNMFGLVPSPLSSHFVETLDKQTRKMW